MMKLKETTTTALSISAFLISLVSAYFTLLRATDDFRVVLAYNPIILELNKVVGVSTDIPFTFINAGNRPVALIDIGLSIWRLEKQATHMDKCGGEERVFNREYRFEPFVVNAGEIAVRTFSLGQEDQIQQWTARKVSITDIASADGKRMLICIDFGIVTPNNTREMVERPIIQQTLHNGAIHFGEGEYTEQYDKKKPIVLYRNWGTIFQN
jgi:hypothetical protein